MTTCGRCLIEDHPSRLRMALCSVSGEELRAALAEIIGEAEEVTEAQHGTPIGALEAIIRRARAALAASSTPEPSGHEHEWIVGKGVATYCRDCGAAPSTEPALDADALVVAMLEAVKGVALRHGIRPTEFLDAANAAANEVRRLAESQS